MTHTYSGNKFPVKSHNFESSYEGVTSKNHSKISINTWRGLIWLRNFVRLEIKEKNRSHFLPHLINYYKNIFVIIISSIEILHLNFRAFLAAYLFKISFAYLCDDQNDLFACPKVNQRKLLIFCKNEEISFSFRFCFYLNTSRNGHRKY